MNARVYYEKTIQDIICITSERPNSGVSDFDIYPELKEKETSDLDFIEIPLGRAYETFSNAKSYKVNVETKKLEVTYYTEEELGAIQKSNQELSDRVSDISQYLNNNKTTISNVEDLILQTEQNKILNGGM